MNVKIRIFENKGVIIALLLLLMKPAYFGQIRILDRIYTYGGAFCLFILIILLFRVKIKKSLIWIMSFYGIILFSTIIGSGNIYQYMKSDLGELAMCLLFYIWLEKNPGLLIEGFAIYDVYIYVNLVTILLFPQGLYSNSMYSHCWFLGYKNPQIRTILPILGMSLIRSFWKYQCVSLQTWCLIVCAAVTFLLIDSATSLVGICIFFLLLFIFHEQDKRIPGFITLINGFWISAAACIMIIFFEMQYLFAGIIEDILGRNLTFTTRVGIWEKTIRFIQRRFLCGYGYLTGTEYGHMYNHIYATHPHNYYMYVLMTGGILLFFVLFLGLLYANEKLNATIDTIYSKIVLFLLYSFLAMGITESLVSTVLLYPMLILAMKSDVLAGLVSDSDHFSLFGMNFRAIKRIRLKFR